MIIDGKHIADTLQKETKAAVEALHRSPLLVAITCAPSFATRNYLQLKTKKAALVGITLKVIELPESSQTIDILTVVGETVVEADGIVIQLPLPAHIDREAVLAAIPKEKDPDGFSFDSESEILPPVVGAIKCIADIHALSFKEKKVVVLGSGRLVGAPAVAFFLRQGALVVALNETSNDIAAQLQTADIIVSGIGQPHFVTSDMVKDGVIIFDAGTSEDGGVVVGDVHPDVAKKASLFTPVPGGIGPITVAVLLKNLLTLIRQEK